MVTTSVAGTGKTSFLSRLPLVQYCMMNEPFTRRNECISLLKEVFLDYIEVSDVS